MAYLRTGAEILERMRRDLKTPSNVGRYKDEDLARFWEEEWANDWASLGAGDYGIGLTRALITGTGPTHTLPSDFLYSLALSRESGDTYRYPGTYASDKMINDQNLYLLTGLGGTTQEWYYQILTDDTDDTLEVLPDLRGDETIRLSYVIQPPNLGDPSNQVAWQAASINVIAEPIYAHTIAAARVRAVSREDQAEYQRALAEWAKRREKFLEQRRARIMASGVGADRSVSTSRRWIGYGR